MAREPKKQKNTDPEKIRLQLENLIRDLQSEMASEELRSNVLAVIPIFNKLRDLGKSFIREDSITAARHRILYYFRKYPHIVISGDELLVVSGIQAYPRRVRELRVEHGWAIASGITIKAMHEEESEEMPDDLKNMKPSEYVLLETERDQDAAHRWKVANTIRKGTGSVLNKILEYFRANVGQRVTGEELRYVANNKTEWARRVRELRSEYGWPVTTKFAGRPDLPIGVYVLEADRQSPEHDRHIQDDVRREVLRRDNYRCKQCEWSHEEWNPSDPRHLELHHIKHHFRGGENVKENLTTLCTSCHDRLHKEERKGHN